MNGFSYDAWVTEQAAAVEAAMREHGRRGIYDDSAYVFRSQGAKPGYLVVANKQPDGCHSVLRFPSHETRLRMIPYSHLRSLIWNACRSEPILPTESE